MFFIIVLLALIELVLADSTRVVNGTDAQIEEFPFMVSLRRNGGHTCGGTIINEWWILTAAHCVLNPILSGYSIQYASTLLDRNGPHVVGVEGVYRHEGYNASNQYINDIALIKVSAPIRNELFDFKVKLPSKWAFFSTGTPAVLIGWGYNATSGITQTILQKADLQIYSSIDCNAIHNDTVHSTNICAGAEGGFRGQCSDKDSGGPLFVNGVQVGIVSWSNKPCAAPPYPGVFTSTSPYIGWIEKKSGVKLSLNTFVQA